MARLLGIDIGTTGVRAAIFDANGALLADRSVPCGHDAPLPGWAEIAPDRWWDAVCTALAGLDGLDAVDAIAVVGQAPTVVLADETGKALAPAVLWLDTRAHAEAAALGVHAYYLGPKLAWLERHRPVTARWILQCHSWIAMQLTGVASVDASTAALCLPMFDLAARQWRDADARLPPVRAAHEVIGGVTAAAAARTGLRAGTPVVAGGGDFAAATLGAGVLDEGEACLMLGTAGNLLVPRRTPGRDARLINAHHVGSDAWLTLGGTMSGGGQEWLRRALGDPSHEVLDGEAAKIETGAGGLLFLPYLQGERTPIWDTTARGSFVGLGLHHGRGHLWRSLLEGIALGFVDCQAVVEEDGVRVTEIIAANGGGKSALFRQILCDALGVPLLYTPQAGGTVAGAAILAALGIGALATAADARRWRGATIRHEPAPTAHARYRELLALRRQAYEGLRPVFAGLQAR